MKNACLYVIIFLLGTIFFMRNVEEPEWNKIDGCLDRGYCWDSIRNRCEEFDQGYCVRDEQDCQVKKGIWDLDKQYCKF